MQLIQLSDGERWRLALHRAGRVVAVEHAVRALGRPAPGTLDELLAAPDAACDDLRALAEGMGELEGVSLDDCRAGPVNPRPGKVLCIGLNYRRHAEETGGAPPPEPVVFGKFANTLVGHRDAVNVAGHERMDYEAELGVMIGTRARRVRPERALDHVLGYFAANDLSDRGLQFRSSQWLLGKTPDGFLPTGPFLRLADDRFDPQSLDIRCRLNGELRQDSNTSDMIFSVAEIIAYLSRAMTLEPGDLIVTGTPEGVILGQEKPRRWMRPGDRVAVEIDGLGTLETPLVGA